jgi:hypothetical protein
MVNQFLIKTKNTSSWSMFFVMENQFFGLTLTEMRGLAFDLAERKEISHNFNKAKKMAV